jgi:photoactive yellow protein
MGIPRLSEAQLGALPFGVIELDLNGVVLIYNKAEEALSGMASSHVIGKNFFQDVAPCTSVKQFEGRFRTFISSQSDPETFDFTFRFPGRTTKVSIAFVRSERASAFVLVKASTETVHRG